MHGRLVKVIPELDRGVVFLRRFAALTFTELLVFSKQSLAALSTLLQTYLCLWLSRGKLESTHAGRSFVFDALYFVIFIYS